MEWFGFWIFLSVVVCVDAWLYSKGHEGLLFTHKTRAEKAMRDRLSEARGGASLSGGIDGAEADKVAR